MPYTFFVSKHGNEDAEHRIRAKASSYSTGGGGTVFEHTVGATMLAALLTRSPVAGLGDDYTISRVVFQASQTSAVDDLIVEGVRGISGPSRRVAFGVRHKPRIAPSDDSFVTLLETYLRTAHQEWEEISTDELRLGLIVAAPHTGARELAALAELARSQTGHKEFYTALSRQGSKIRQRLDLLQEAVRKVNDERNVEPDVELLTWRLLFALHPIQVALEGDDAVDRRRSIVDLRDVATDNAAASDLFVQLCGLASKYAPLGATISETNLRRDLSGLSTLRRSAAYDRAWTLLDGLSDRLLQRTGRQLASSDKELKLDRAEVLQELTEALRQAVESNVSMVVHGQPDVGKSALTLSVAEGLRSQGQEVIALSLRDLPATVIEAEHLLGVAISDLIGAMAVSPTRALLIDGGEAASEDRFDMLAHLAHCTRATGVTLVVVTRSDARERAVEALMSREGGSYRPIEVEVPPLTTSEINAIAGAFPSFERLARGRRTSWLLGRPGLVNLLLKAEAQNLLPEGPLSEADIFAVVWRRLVRRGDTHEPGRGTPDGRERVLIGVARSQLLGEAAVPADPDTTALPSLRSDGVLFSPGPTGAWGVGEQFSTDLLRDFALARLFILDRFSTLKKGGAPRWAIRSAVLACQAALAAGGVQRWLEFRSSVTDISHDSGERWADVPLEAMITFGNAAEVLNDAWPALIEGEGDGLKRLCRVVLQRFGDSYSIDHPTLVEPVVQFLFDRQADLKELAFRGVWAQVSEIFLKWLRGMALRGAQDDQNRLRAALRDRFLSEQVGSPDEDDLEYIALMGSDLDEQATNFLRAVGMETPWWLGPCVESPAVVVSMATHQPGLLLFLTDAYYIDRRLGDDFRFSPMDDGIRHHRGKGGFSSHLASAWYGPFASLLQASPPPTFALINRMLDHAVRARVRLLNNLGSGPLVDVPEDQLPSITITLPSLGERRFVGDSQAWEWYRGSSVGPYPCMSALLAVELYLDRLVQLGIPLQLLVDRVLEAANNLAMPGLVVGFLARHVDAVTTELDCWLVEPAIWELEFSRASKNGRLHVQGPDPDDLVGRANRSFSLREMAMVLTIRTISDSDTNRLDTLRTIASQLIERAETIYGNTPGSGDRMTTVRNWASFLVVENFEKITYSDGTVGYTYTPPAVSTEYEKQQSDLDRGMKLIGLLKYSHHDSRELDDLSELRGDLQLARELHQQPPELGREFLREALPAIAATAIVACGKGQFDLSVEELAWAASLTIEAAHATTATDEFDVSLFSMGYDRSAAQAIPCLLLPLKAQDGPLVLDEEDNQVIHAALTRLMTSGSEEVRRRTARSLDRVWLSACLPWTAPGTCVHEIAFAAVEDSVRDCRMGPFDRELQRRRRNPIEHDPCNELAEIPGEDLRPGRMTAAIVATAACAMSSCCVQPHADSLLKELVMCHARAAVRSFRENFQLDHDPEVEQWITERLIQLAGSGRMDLVTRYVRTLSEEPLALSSCLSEVARVATYQIAERHIVKAVWPYLMDDLLSLLESNPASLSGSDRRGRRNEREAIASLVLRPQLRFNDGDPGSTLSKAQEDWFEVEPMTPLLTRWIQFAVGVPECVDSLVGFVYTLPPSLQASPGLEWVTSLIGGHFDRVASKTWALNEWLDTLKASVVLRGEQLAQFQHLVDGLASQGDRRAVTLQKSLE